MLIIKNDDEMNVFISQPMNGKTKKEILEARKKAIETIKNKFCYVGELNIIDSFIENIPSNAKPLWFLGKSLELLSSADAIYFVDGWIKSRGCTIEYLCASMYGINILKDN